MCRGVSAISSSTHGSCIYTAGADGMICEIDSLSGNLLQKFRASTKAISCMSVSSGKYHLHLLWYSCLIAVVNEHIVLIVVLDSR